MASSVNSSPFGPSARDTPAQAAAGERDVGGDRNIAHPSMLDDPVISRVEPTPHHDELDEWLLRYPQRRIGDHEHLDLVPPRDAVDLLLDRAGIGINVDGHRSC